MLTWYAGAVAAALMLLIGACISGATLSDILVGVSTGILATTAMIFIVQKIIEDIDTNRQAPAILVSLRVCLEIYQIFKYTWIEIGSVKNLVHDDTDWTNAEFFNNIERLVSPRDTLVGGFVHGRLLGSNQPISCEQYLDVTHDLFNQLIDEVLTRHIFDTDPDIITMLYVLRKQGYVCSSFFNQTYKGKQHFTAEFIIRVWKKFGIVFCMAPRRRPENGSALKVAY